MRLITFLLKFLLFLSVGFVELYVWVYAAYAGSNLAQTERLLLYLWMIAVPISFVFSAIALWKSQWKIVAMNPIVFIAVVLIFYRLLVHW
jgi:hypothetical protein